MPPTEVGSSPDNDQVLACGHPMQQEDVVDGSDDLVMIVTSTPGVTVMRRLPVWVVERDNSTACRYYCNHDNQMTVAECCSRSGVKY